MFPIMTGRFLSLPSVQHPADSGNAGGGVLLRANCIRGALATAVSPRGVMRRCVTVGSFLYAV